jgi:hypothetical protein
MIGEGYMVFGNAPVASSSMTTHCKKFALSVAHGLGLMLNALKAGWRYGVGVKFYCNGCDALRL